MQTESFWVTALVAIVFFAVAGAKALHLWRQKPTTGMQGLQGQRGTAHTDLNPEGMVDVAGELWKARSPGDAIPAGSPVEVVGGEGLVLRVRKV